ncbi:MAG: tRNA pseudouridine(55) synthase TruB [Bacteroidia bacterium]|nr:tRNA pseudouridine(55) synthase TruB [Bacteroidia bacterium]
MKEITTQEGGFLLIDKPIRWTSFDVVKKLRNISRIKKIGHAGTLDPLATGLLIICYGKYTKKIESMQAQEKGYIGSFELGKTTPSFDLETAIDNEYPIDHITPQFLEEKLELFRGDIKQVPPQFSAVKVNGKRAYEHARKGKKIELKIRDTHISKFEVDHSSFPTLKFKIKCAKGTYIRSLARDFGYSIDSGAYMSSLTRTSIGDYLLSDAVQISDIRDTEDFFKFARQLSS